MNTTWEYSSFKTDYRNRTECFYCGLRATKDSGESVLLEATVVLGENQKKLESLWSESEINDLLLSVKNSSFTDEIINQSFMQEA